LSANKKRRKNRYKTRTAKKKRAYGRPIAALCKAIAVIFLFGAMSFSFIFGYDYITQCSYFNAKQVTVEGTHKLTEENVRHQAGISKGVNILAVNLSLARKRLIAHPRIADASVSRELPSTIVVRIKEHVPLAILDLGRKFVVNSEGEIFKEMDASEPRNLPVVTGLTFSDITAGDSPRSETFKAVMAMLHLGKTGGSILPNKKIKRIDVDRELGLTLYTGDRVKTIKVGYDNYRKKLQKLGNVLLYIERRKRFSRLDSIDLNNINRIVITPAATDSPDGDHKEV